MKKAGLADIKEVTEEIMESRDGAQDAEASGGAWKRLLAAAVAIAAILIVYLVAVRKVSGADGSDSEDGGPVAELNEETGDGTETFENGEEEAAPGEAETLQVSVDITDHYITHKGDPDNLYHIDEDHVLWGCGRNNCGQLGQGTQDYEFHEEPVKIAENVVHVDYSQRGFVIFLTDDHKLYGMGNAGCGALQQYETFEWERYVNGEHYYVSEPYLLAVNVSYACCGRDDIVCLNEDGSVWTWGTVYDGYFIARPKKIFERAVFVTGGWGNHAALLSNGSVWTWGHNGAGNCGVEQPSMISDPTMAAGGAVMVWTDRSLDSGSQLDQNELTLAWTGRLKYTEYDTISEYDTYPRYLQNTVIQKPDGSYWVCGENVGTQEKVVHGELGDYSVVCSSEFQRCE